MHRRFRMLLITALLLSVTGCAPKLVGIEIVGPPRPVLHGDWGYLSAIGIYEGWGRMPVAAVWSETGDACKHDMQAAHTTSFIAAQPGTSVFTATRGAFSDTFEVTVLPSKIVRMDIFALDEMEAGEAKLVYARGYDIRDRMLLKDPNWSVTDELGEFSEVEGYEGHECAIEFKALKGGVGTISVEKDGVVASRRIIINPYVPYLASMSIRPDYYEVPLGNLFGFYIEPRDQAGKYFTVSPSWSLEGDIGDLLPYGNDVHFLAKKLGTGILRASYQGFLATATIVVKQRE